VSFDDTGTASVTPDKQPSIQPAEIENSKCLSYFYYGTYMIHKICCIIFNYVLLDFFLEAFKSIESTTTKEYFIKPAETKYSNYIFFFKYLPTSNVLYN